MTTHRRRRALLVATPILSVLAVLLAWQWWGSRINPILLSTPSEIWSAFREMAGDGRLWEATWVTAYTFVIGLMIGMVVGSLLGIAMGRYRWLARILDVHVRILYSTPIIALFPLFILWVGTGVEMRLIAISISALLPAIISAEDGVREVDPELGELATVYGATEWETFRKIVAPATVPFIATGFRQAIGRTIVTTVAIELLTSQDGIGGLMGFYGNQLQTAKYFVALGIAVLLSLVLYALGNLVERRFSAWRVEPI